MHDVSPGSPCTGHLAQGDVIVKVDQTDTAHLSRDELVQRGRSLFEARLRAGAVQGSGATATPGTEHTPLQPLCLQEHPVGPSPRPPPARTGAEKGWAWLRNEVE